jgi:hypothetical protein
VHAHRREARRVRSHGGAHARGEGDVGEHRDRAEAHLPIGVDAMVSWLERDARVVGRDLVVGDPQEVAGEVESRRAVQRDAAQHTIANVHAVIIAIIRRR